MNDSHAYLRKISGWMAEYSLAGVLLYNPKSTKCSPERLATLCHLALLGIHARVTLLVSDCWCAQQSCDQRSHHSAKREDRGHTLRHRHLAALMFADIRLYDEDIYLVLEGCEVMTCA